MRCIDGAADTEDADAGGKTNVTENGQVSTLPVFIIGKCIRQISFLKNSKRIGKMHTIYLSLFFGFHKKTIECTLCEHSIVMNYKESGFNLENYI